MNVVGKNKISNIHQEQDFYQQQKIKGVDKKNLNFCFANISATIHRIFKILVPTPHNIPLIIWGRHKNLKIPCIET